MDARFYNTPAWKAVSARAKQRDGNCCTVARLLGGDCSDVLHAHHIVPRAERPDLELDLDNVGTVCSVHHPTWEAVRRFVTNAKHPLPPCRHRHPYQSGRIACENERRRKAGLPLIEA